MTTAFILISTEPDAMENVLQALINVEGVVEGYSLYGVYDVIAKIEAKDIEVLREIFDKIRRLRGVSSAVTSITIEGF